MPLRVYLEWYRHYQVEPWGWEADNWRMGMICATVLNGLIAPDEPFTPNDFIPDRHSDKPQQTAEDQKNILLSMMARNGSESSDDNQEA